MDLARSLPCSDTGFHAAEDDPTNLKLCQRGEWQDRMLVETVLSMLDIMTSNGGRLTPDVTRVSLPEARAA